VPPFEFLTRGRSARTASGLRFEVVMAGSGRRPKPTDIIEIHYAGWLSTRRCFDETFSTGVPLEIDLGSARRKPVLDLVPGLREGLARMAVGSAYRFVLPPHLAYGLRGRKDLGIGPNRRLYYYVELVGIRDGER
jgi:FKBP-type peptidyl-prolyl cis-trans isomerase